MVVCHYAVPNKMQFTTHSGAICPVPRANWSMALIYAKCISKYADVSSTLPTVCPWGRVSGEEQNWL